MAGGVDGSQEESGGVLLLLFEPILGSGCERKNGEIRVCEMRLMGEGGREGVTLRYVQMPRAKAGEGERRRRKAAAAAASLRERERELGLREWREVDGGKEETVTAGEVAEIRCAPLAMLPSASASTSSPPLLFHLFFYKNFFSFF